MILALVLATMALGPAGASPTVNSVGRNGFLRTDGIWIVNSEGRRILLRGVNYPGLSWEPQPDKHKEAAYRRFAEIGCNVVRLPISWAHLEPLPGVFDDKYLYGYVDKDIRWARKYGLFVVLDMAQWKWAERFGGNGVPDWAVQAYPPTEGGMRKFASDFWVNSTLQGHLSQVWRWVASIYANEPTIAGYDLFNEPWSYTLMDSNMTAKYVHEFYLNVIESVRDVDLNHMIFLEPIGTNSLNITLEKSIVWSPHFYPLAFTPTYFAENVTLLEADLAAKYRKFVIEFAKPMWIGEFGAFMKDDSYINWLHDAIGLFDRYQIGWAWWPINEGLRQQIPSVISLSS